MCEMFFVRKSRKHSHLNVWTWGIYIDIAGPIILETPTDITRPHLAIFQPEIAPPSLDTREYNLISDLIYYISCIFQLPENRTQLLIAWLRSIIILLSALVHIAF